MANADTSLTTDEVRKVALLARLALTPSDEEMFARQLGQILGYVRRLQALDLTGVEPMAHAVPLPAPERPDEVVPSLPREEVLRNAPQRVADGIAVPKIIE
jgi:aspartyl-tRNA(Asn)/glutamyl-tRNA(Gln) amidotransferase subunit C